MAQQTAVHELFLKWLRTDLTTEDFEQAKAMEKEQIEKAIDEALIAYGIIKK